MTRALALAAAVAVAPGCVAPPSAADVGERCDATIDCRSGLECNEPIANDSRCLPPPATRVVADCLPGGPERQCAELRDALWPVEAACDADTARCACPVDFYACADGFVFERFTCLCMPLAEVGTACVTATTCRSGQCSDGVCTCLSRDDCEDGVCVFGSCTG